MIYMGIFMQKFLKKFRQKPLFMLLPSAAAFLILSVLFLHFHQDADQAFSKYTSELFRQEISGNTITLHYTLKNPENYGINNTPILWTMHYRPRTRPVKCRCGTHQTSVS